MMKLARFSTLVSALVISGAAAFRVGILADDSTCGFCCGNSSEGSPSIPADMGNSEENDTGKSEEKVVVVVPNSKDKTPQRTVVDPVKQPAERLDPGSTADLLAVVDEAAADLVHEPRRGLGSVNDSGNGAPLADDGGAGVVKAEDGKTTPGVVSAGGVVGIGQAPVVDAPRAKTSADNDTQVKEGSRGEGASNGCASCYHGFLLHSKKLWHSACGKGGAAEASSEKHKARREPNTKQESTNTKQESTNTKQEKPNTEQENTNTKQEKHNQEEPKTEQEKHNQENSTEAPVPERAVPEPAVVAASVVPYYSDPQHWTKGLEYADYYEQSQYKEKCVKNKLSEENAYLFTPEFQSRPEKYAERISAENFVFFGDQKEWHGPFSNWYRGEKYYTSSALGDKSAKGKPMVRRFWCSEQEFQYMKALAHGSREGDDLANKILNREGIFSDPRENGSVRPQQAMQNQCRDLYENTSIPIEREGSQKNWRDNKLSAMADICYNKFERNNHLKNLLLSTGDKTLVDANSDKCGDLLDGEEFKKNNLLGRALMMARLRFLIEMSQRKETPEHRKLRQCCKVYYIQGKTGEGPYVYYDKNTKRIATSPVKPKNLRYDE